MTEPHAYCTDCDYVYPADNGHLPPCRRCGSRYFVRPIDLPRRTRFERVAGKVVVAAIAVLWIVGLAL